MSKFIAVIHTWHVHSDGFKVHALESGNRKDAEREAAWLSTKAKGFCRSSAYEVIEIGDTQGLLPRQLTWKERLTGKLEEF